MDLKEHIKSWIAIRGQATADEMQPVFLKTRDILEVMLRQMAHDGELVLAPYRVPGTDKRHEFFSVPKPKVEPAKESVDALLEELRAKSQAMRNDAAIARHERFKERVAARRAQVEAAMTAKTDSEEDGEEKGGGSAGSMSLDVKRPDPNANDRKTRGMRPRR